MGKDKRKKSNFEIEIKIRFKKILDSDTQILAHLMKENLERITEQIKNFVANNIIETDLDKDLDKQLKKPREQLMKIEISPEVMDRIIQAGKPREPEPEEITPVITAPAIQENVVTVPPASTVTAEKMRPEITPQPSVQTITVPDLTAPEKEGITPSVPEISFSIPKVSLKKEEEKPASIIDEEDVATGIAILRKQMLLELKKIRSVVAEEDEF